MPLEWIIPAAATVFGSIIGNRGRQRAARTSAQGQQEITEQQLASQRESALLGMESGMLEQRRRQQEAAFRAGKLEDVASMFQGLQGPSFGGATAQQVTAQQVGPLAQVAELEDMAREMRAQEGSLDLRRAAMRELDLGGEAMNAALAASGVRGSGFGASQVRGMTGDVLGGLAQQIQQSRMQALSGAAGIMGQAGQMDLSRLTANQQAALNAAVSNQGAALQAAGINQQAAQAAANFGLQRAQGISQVYQDEAFGANAPLDLSREEELMRRYAGKWGMEDMLPGGSITGPIEGGGIPSMPGGGPKMYAGGTPDFDFRGPTVGTAGGAGGMAGFGGLSPSDLLAAAQASGGGSMGAGMAGIGGMVGPGGMAAMLGAGRGGVPGYDRNRAVV